MSGCSPTSAIHFVENSSNHNTEHVTRKIALLTDYLQDQEVGGRQVAKCLNLLTLFEIHFSIQKQYYNKTLNIRQKFLNLFFSTETEPIWDLLYLSWGLPGGFLGVAWGYRGVDLSNPPGKTQGRPDKYSLYIERMIH